MNKKNYLKPELKTRKVALGVFGDYGDNPKRGGGGRGGNSPTDVVERLNLRME